MQDLEKNVDDFKNDLFSGKTDLVISTIESIKQTSHYEIVDSLFDLYLTTQKNEIKAQLFNLFIDIKDERFVEKLVLSIGKPKFSIISKDLISICWQTGLDFSQHIDQFISKLFTESDEIAIECFSVIESSIEFLSEEKRKSLVSILNKKKNDFDGVKKGLIEEIIYMLA